MFQNIKEEYAKPKKESIFSNVFSLSYIPIYIVSFMISLVGLGGGVSPFSISMLAACMSNSVPLLGIAITGLIGNAISFGLEGAFNYLLISLVLIVSTFIIKPM